MVSLHPTGMIYFNVKIVVAAFSSGDLFALNNTLASEILSHNSSAHAGIGRFEKFSKEAKNRARTRIQKLPVE
jgi:hypothetical protein